MTGHRTFTMGLAAAALAAATALTGAVAFGAPPTDRPGGPGQRPNATTTATAPLSDPEKADLILTREEERLAREFYLAFGEEHDVATFERIAASEARHFEAAGRMLTRYDVRDPSADAKPGVYTNTTLQKLYTDWSARGMQSKDKAIQVGVELEKADIEGLKKAIETSDNADLDRVYGNLLRGSEHHLAAYEALARGEDPANGQCQQANGSRQGQGPGAGQGPGQQHPNGQGQRHGWR